MARPNTMLCLQRVYHISQSQLIRVVWILFFVCCLLLRERGRGQGMPRVQDAEFWVVSRIRPLGMLENESIPLFCSFHVRCQFIPDCLLSGRLRFFFVHIQRRPVTLQNMNQWLSVVQPVAVLCEAFAHNCPVYSFGEDTSQRGLDMAGQMVLGCWRPSLLGWRPSRTGWRLSLPGWRPLLLNAIKLEAIASKLEAIATRVEAIISRTERTCFLESTRSRGQ